MSIDIDAYKEALAMNTIVKTLDQVLMERVEALTAERDRLRAALVGLVGVSTRAELELMEMALRGQPAPAEDKAASIDAIHALLATAKD